MPKTDAQSNHRAPSKFAASLVDTPIQINTYNIAEVKHALDDSVRKILKQDHGFTEDNTHVDRKLALGYAACFFAIGSAAYGHLNDFAETRVLVGLGIVLYSFFNSAMLLYTWLVEKETVFVGVRTDELRIDPDEKVTVTAKCNKHAGEYSVSLTLTGGSKKKSGAARKTQFSKSIGCFFDVDGELVASPLVRDVGALLADKKSE
ncbi:microsomal signal peptidase 25 kDa subunit-domain-containing protein [Chytriomyces sp. MP71]|nr:microsomal signal peptidase 25 kDa subunit-domain-containing protein [Chytriomyces sp. MP71]